ncbi:MAG: CoA transferase [Chloroflexota bacterium]|nr:CoA transferase [Chloroflexota bacterium]
MTAPAPNLAPPPLGDVVVLELATGVAGPYCGRLLADLGAQVIKVEPPEGDPARAELPLVDGESAFFAWLAAGKLNATLPLDDPRVEQLAARADIIVHSERGEAADRLEERLAAASERAVVLSLSPYGRSGGRADWQATSFTEYATGGYHYFGGDPEREPVALPGHQVPFHAGTHGALAALAGLRHTREHGQGQRIEVSHQEAILNDHAWLTTIWTHQGVIQSRTGSIFVPCADGFVFLFNLAPYPNLFILIERFDLLEDESLQQPLVWTERFDEVLEAFGEWTKTRTKQEIYHAAQELRIAVTPVNTMADVAASEQLAARDWFGTLCLGDRELLAPGLPYKLDETALDPATAAPAPGEHTDAVLAPDFPWANAGVARPASASTPTGQGPLAGLRFIEVTANWAGPIAGRHFADLGADVIKVELHTKPATRTLAWVPADIWPDHYHRAGYFNKLNRNKRAVCLNLATDEGRGVLLELVKQADGLIENNAARVMTQLGIGWDVLREVNPGLVMCSMAGFGATGPERNYSAYGSNIEAMSGLASVLGYGPGEYYGTGSYYADPVTGNHGAVAMLAALHARRATGKGRWIDVSLFEAVLPYFSQELLTYAVTGEAPEPIGNASPVHAPQGLYPCAGEDNWLALTVRDERDFAALAEVVGCPELAADPQLATVEGRRANAGAIDNAIAAWSREQTVPAAAAALQEAGVPAAPVMPNWMVVSDNHLNDRGYFKTVRHPVAGTHVFPGFPWRFEQTPGAIARPAPLFAQHNREVFSGLLGMSDAAIEALYAANATNDDAQYAAGPSL